jgi:hypothetical protein
MLILENYFILTNIRDLFFDVFLDKKVLLIGLILQIWFEVSKG